MQTLRKYQAGLSLIELMIAMTLGLLILAGLIVLFVQNKQSHSQDEMIAQMQEDGRFAMSELVGDISMAGFWATLLDPTTITPDPASLTVTTDCGPAGATGTGSNAAIYQITTYPAIGISNNETSTNVATDFSCINSSEFESGSDVLYILRVDGTQTTLANLQDGHVYLESNGTSGTLFEKITGTSPPPLNGTLQYWEYDPMVYYVRNYSVTSGDGIPALCRKELSISSGSPTMTTECIAEGIEDMQVEFGIDTDKDGVANEYLSSPTTAQMNHAVSARVFLLGRSVDPDYGYTNGKTYQAADATAYTPNDHYYRRVYTTTILLRNPTNLNRMGR